jgi:hypothetical protein
MHSKVVSMWTCPTLRPLLGEKKKEKKENMTLRLMKMLEADKGSVL